MTKRLRFYLLSKLTLDVTRYELVYLLFSVYDTVIRQSINQAYVNIAKEKLEHCIIVCSDPVSWSYRGLDSISGKVQTWGRLFPGVMPVYSQAEFKIGL